MSSRDQGSSPSSVQLDRRQMLMLGAGLAMTASGVVGSELSQAQSLDQKVTAPNLFEGIDTVVVLMMENRSFDHYFGMINGDNLYPSVGQVEGFRGDEANLDQMGNRVTPYPLTSRTQADPPHSWNSCHKQWNEGKNDGFVREHAGPSEREVMGYFDRRTLPFSYWLADNFTLCDRWFAGIMGPTWPNRAVLHATNAGGLKQNTPYIGKAPQTIWEVLPKVGKTGKNYYAGKVACYTGMYLGKVLTGKNPTAPIDDFFKAAKAGTLPAFSMIDPDFETNDDHPSHDVQLGQALIASIYQAMARSPQWSRSLFIVTYDEHGGFFDHVPPPTCKDANPEFRQLGFRVPSLVIGPTVRRGAVCHETLEHSSVAATLKSCFGLPSLSARMDASADLAACIDPNAVGAPLPPPDNAPLVRLDRSLLESSLRRATIHAQPELAGLIADGQIPAHAMDPRDRQERIESWLRHAQELGAVALD